jgi:hypothetical protein
VPDVRHSCARRHATQEAGTGPARRARAPSERQPVLVQRRCRIPVHAPVGFDDRPRVKNDSASPLAGAARFSRR